MEELHEVDQVRTLDKALTVFTAPTNCTTASPASAAGSLVPKSNCRVYCCVPLCTSARSKHPDVSFHRFPTADPDFKRRQLWIEKVCLDKPPSPTMVICSRHFQPLDFFYSGYFCYRRRLKRTAVPSRNLPKPRSVEEITKTEVHLVHQEHESYGYTENDKELQILACMSTSAVVRLKRTDELLPEKLQAALLRS